MQISNLPVNRETLFSDELPPDYLYEKEASALELSREVIDDIKLKNLITSFGFDFTIRVCCKTGKLIERRNSRDITQAIAILGESKAIELLSHENTRNPVIQWTYTDSDSLDKLMLHDPIGYCVYGLSIILDKYGPLHRFRALHPKVIDKIRAEYETAKFQWTMQKHELHTVLQYQELSTVIRINERIRAFLTMVEVAKLPEKFEHFGSIEELSAGQSFLSFVGENLDFVENAINRTLRELLSHAEAKGHISYAQDYDKLLKFQEKFGGYSSFAGQGKPRGIGTLANYGAVMNIEMRKAGISDWSIREMEAKIPAFHGKKTIFLERGQMIAERGKLGKQSFKLAPRAPVQINSENSDNE